jgi:hypothetical protein
LECRCTLEATIEQFLKVSDPKVAEKLKSVIERIDDKMEATAATDAERKFIAWAAAASETEKELPVPDLVGSDFIQVLDALPRDRRSESTSLDSAVEACQDHLHAAVNHAASAILEDGSLDLLAQGCKNLLALEAWLKTPPQSIDPDVINGLVSKGSAIARAFEAVKAANSKSNLAAFNKAMVSWLGFKLAVERQSDFHIGFVQEGAAQVNHDSA